MLDSGYALKDCAWFRWFGQPHDYADAQGAVLEYRSIRFVKPARVPFTRIRGRVASRIQFWVISWSLLAQVQIPRLPLLSIASTRVESSVYSDDLLITSATSHLVSWRREPHPFSVGVSADMLEYLAGGPAAVISRSCLVFRMSCALRLVPAAMLAGC